jgi:hypothetical protein
VGLYEPPRPSRPEPRTCLCLALLATAGCAATASGPGPREAAIRCAADEIKIAWGETGASEHSKAASSARADVFVEKAGGDYWRTTRAAQDLAQKTRKSGRVADAGVCEAMLTPEDRQHADSMMIENVADTPDRPDR